MLIISREETGEWEVVERELKMAQRVAHILSYVSIYIILD